MYTLYYLYIYFLLLATLVAAIRQVQISAAEAKMSFKDYGRRSL